MICLNCGNPVTEHDANCRHCKIQLKKHGILYTNSNSEETINSKEKCHNCGSQINPDCDSCQTCRYPYKSSVFNPKSGQDFLEKGNRLEDQDRLPGPINFKVPQTKEYIQTPKRIFKNSDFSFVS